MSKYISFPCFRIAMRHARVRQSGMHFNRFIFKLRSSVLSGAASSGLTLAEILVAVAIAGVLFSVIGSALLNHMLDARRIETSQRLRELTNRINYLLTVEGSEAAEVQYSPVIPLACSSGADEYRVRDSLFVLKIPKDDGPYGTNLNVSSVFYYNSLGGDLIRCGPLAKRNGVLNHDQLAPSASIISRGTVLSVISSDGATRCEQEFSQDRQVAYQLSFSGGGSTYTPPCAIARAKTIFVCNPAASGGSVVSSDAQIGQCGL